MASSRRRATNVGPGFRIYPASVPNLPSLAPEQDKPSSNGGYSGRPPPNSTLTTEAQQFGDLPSRPGNNGDLSRAAAVLLANFSALSLSDLCSSCSRVLQDRLSSIASGNCLDPSSSVDSDKKSSLHSVENAETNNSLEIDVTESIPEDQAKSREGEKPAKGHDEKYASHSNDSVDTLVSRMASQSFSSLSITEANEVKTAGHMLSLPENVEESTRIQQVKRKKDFVLHERVNGMLVNVVEGLELHMNVFNDSEQKELINCIYHLQEQGRSQMLRRRTYSEPRKWMRGKGRVTIQFGCCYNYAVDKEGNPPGIIRDEEVDPMPEMFRMVIKRLVRWHVLPPNCVPDSCIVNIYDVGDCIPPHIDHHDFVRPFCTISLLSKCNIIFGSSLKILGPGDFQGSLSIPLPMGSVLVLNGNGADVAKHAVPAVPTRRISITFRKMDPSKVPQGFKPDQELLRTGAFRDSRQFAPMNQITQVQPKAALQRPEQKQSSKVPLFTLDSDFPPLGG